MATITTMIGVQIFTTGPIPNAITHKNIISSKASIVSFPCRRGSYKSSSRIARFQPQATGPGTPKDLSSKVNESIGKAQETCADDPESGECVAAWDEVEELSAAASHARDKLKTTDPLEEYCKDNPSTDECRTYED